jgi:hypothetical protein
MRPQRRPTVESQTDNSNFEQDDDDDDEVPLSLDMPPLYCCLAIFVCFSLPPFLPFLFYDTLEKCVLSACVAMQTHPFFLPLFSLFLSLSLSFSLLQDIIVPFEGDDEWANDF